MSRNMNKNELTQTLGELGVAFPPTATMVQLRNLLVAAQSEGEEVQLHEEAASKVGADRGPDVEIGGPNDIVERDLDEAIALMEKKKRLLLLERELNTLEEQSTSGLQKLAISDVDGIVPKFSGDNAYPVEKWLSDFDNAVKIGTQSEHFKYMCMRRLLSGTAAIFLRTSAATNYTELKAALLKQFKRNVSTNDVYRELYKRHRQPNENILSYMLSMKEIAAQANLREEEVVNAVIEGLRDNTAYASVLYTAKTLEELQELLIKYDKKRASDRAFQRAGSSSGPVARTRCFNCSQLGHYSSQCPKPKRDIGSCFRCGSKDHVIKQCKQAETKRVNAITKEADASDEIYPVEPYQTVSIAFHKWNLKEGFENCVSLIDSGSPVSFVSKNLVPFEVDDIDEVVSNYQSLGGVNIKTYGKIDSKILLNNRCKTLSLLIVSNNILSKPLLLGRDFLNLFEIKLFMLNRNEIDKLDCDSCNTTSNENFIQVPQLLPKENIIDLPKYCPTSSDCIIGKSDCLPKIDRCVVESASVKDENIEEYMDGLSCPPISDRSMTDNIGVDSENLNGLGSEGFFLFREGNIVCEMNVDAICDDNSCDYDINCSLPKNAITAVKNIIYEYYSNTPKGNVIEPFEMSIKLISEQPIFSHPRRLSYRDKFEVQKIVRELLDKGIIRYSESPYASPIVLVKKKNGETRMCIDYRNLNKVTVRDNYPLPLIEDCLEYLGGKKYFTLLDLKSGFHQVKVSEESIRYTSFVTPDGQFEYVMMPFGLKNAPSVFQRFITFILKDFIDKGLLIVYMDDILIATVELDEHLSLLKLVLQKIAKCGLQLKLSKCKFVHSNIEYLGYEVDHNGIAPSDRHKEAIRRYPIPKTLKQLHSFIGLCAYFRKFVPQFSKIAKPLYDMLKKGSKFELSKAGESAIEELKSKLIKSPVLAIYNPKSETELHCDASAQGFGAVILQRQADKRFHPVFYFSKRTTAAESKYHSFELETLSIIYALRRFRVYLEGIPFKIVTDCNSLTLTLNKKTLNPRIARWALELQNYEYTIQHRGGCNMGHVDALSRSELVLAINEDDLEFQLQATQNRDPDILKVREKLEKESSKFFDLKDGLVYRKDMKGQLYFYVPREMENNVIRCIHEKIAHLGINKTYNQLRMHYWFPDMKPKIEKFVKNCLKCIVYSAPARIDERSLHSIPKKPLPFDTIHIDHLGPLPSLKSKRKHLLVVIDAFTKYVKLYPVNSTSTKEVIDSLKKYFQYYSRPGRIISDRGTCFTSLEFSEFLVNHNISHIKVAVGSPQANGQVERVNRVLTPMLSKLSEPLQHSDWVSKLSSIEYAINNSLHSSTGKTPSDLLFGVRQKGPIIDELTEYLEDQHMGQQRNLTAVRLEANGAILASQRRNERYFEQGHRPAKNFAVGDFVVIKNVDSTVGTNKKLIPRFKGPYIIHKTLPNDRYVVRDVENCQITQLPYTGIIESRFIRLWKTINREEE